MSKGNDFIRGIRRLTADYDADGNGFCGYSIAEIVDILKKEYPIIFEAYNELKEKSCEGESKMSKLYICPIWDTNCPYFCHQDKEGTGDYGLCLMQEMENCSPANECEAFDGVDAEEFVV